MQASVKREAEAELDDRRKLISFIHSGISSKFVGGLLATFMQGDITGTRHV